MLNEKGAAESRSLAGYQVDLRITVARSTHDRLAAGTFGSIAQCCSFVDHRETPRVRVLPSMFLLKTD